MTDRTPEEIAASLTQVQRRGLVELNAACAEARKFHGGKGFVTTRMLCGTPAERSARNIRSIADLGLAYGNKPAKFCAAPQAQWLWTDTDLGRAVAACISQPKETTDGE